MARARFAGEDRTGSHRRGAPEHRGAARADARGTRYDRIRIAQAAARLIAEHGISDWSLAKRKAARALMLPESASLPSNDDVIAALTEHHALFGGAAHRQALRAQREEGLVWMRNLAQWEPLIVGGVAAGWAGAHSDVRLELQADDPKAVEMELAGLGIAYTASPPTGEAMKQSRGTELRIDSPRATIRLTILTPAQRRNRPRRDEPRLSINELASLLRETA